MTDLTLAGFLPALWSGLQATTWPEAIAVLLGLAYVLLALKQNRWCWVAGGASSLILAWLSARSRLPMQALLQLWYVGMAVYGWRRWSQPQASRIGTWPLRLHAVGVAASLAVSVLVARWLASETQAAWPYLDSATTVLSLLATWLVARMKLENWLYWLAIDAVLVFLFAAQGLVFTATLFALYLVLAAAGYVSWNAKYRAQTSPA